MSGFEVAGIVLGSIPLLISALEHYCDGVNTLQRWRKYERELRSLIRNLQTERTKLQNVCEKLLDGLVPLSELEEMIQNPHSDLWKKDTIHRKIRGRLWEASDVFETTVCDVNLAMEEMRQRLDSQNDGKVSEFRRGIFTLRRSTYEDLLKRIKDGVAELENLTDRNIDLEPSRRVRSQKKLLKILRDVSRSLYRALRASLGCGCSHDLGIKLERRIIDIMPGDDDDKIICELAFEIELSSPIKDANQNSDTNKTSTWQQVVVKLEKSNSLQTASLAPMRSIQTATKPKMKKNVSFSFSQSTATSSSTTSSTTLVQSYPDLQTTISQLTTGIMSFGLSCSAPETAAHLCDMLREKQLAQHNNSYGVIVDAGSGPTRRYVVYPSPISKSPAPWSLVSLRDILEGRHGYMQVPLSYRDRLHLAVVISSSVLQLYGTPWLPESLTSRRIFFMTVHEIPIYSRPLFLAEHGQNPKPNTFPTSPHNDKLSLAFHRDPRLLSLGYLLIELILGQTLESLRTNQSNTSFPPGSPLADYITAQNVLGKVRTESSNYCTAVTRCLEGEFHQRGCGLDDEELCQDVYAGVVTLLEKDLENS